MQGSDSAIPARRLRNLQPILDSPRTIESNPGTPGLYLIGRWQWPCFGRPNAS
ncbi:hypothetical protein RSAG8_09453, partial [Rhizoctonia solani AG-8 WAC10335]